MISTMQVAVISALFAVVATAPQYASEYTTPVPIISQKQELNPDGSYSFSYQAGNGIAAEEKGTIKSYGSGPDDQIQGVQGYFLYPGSDGNQYSLAYTADENGFIASGSHLPTSPPIPEEILKALQTLPKDDTQYDERGFPIKGGSFRR